LEILKGGGFQKPKLLKEIMKPNWNFWRVGMILTEKPSVGGIWIFSGTTQSYDKAGGGGVSTGYTQEKI